MDHNGFILLRKTDQKNREGRYLHEVKCPHCPRTFLAVPKYLGGRIRSCGCLKGKRKINVGEWETLLIRKTDQQRGDAFLYEVQCPLCPNTFLGLPKQLGRQVFSCGCLRRATCAEQGRQTAIDYSDEQVNYLRPVEQVGRNKRQLVLWKCICTYNGCGNEVIITSKALHQGQVSCGCKWVSDMRRRFLEKYK